jgi:hypothetical protein
VTRAAALLLDGFAGRVHLLPIALDGHNVVVDFLTKGNHLGGKISAFDGKLAEPLLHVTNVQQGCLVILAASNHRAHGLSPFGSLWMTPAT